MPTYAGPSASGLPSGSQSARLCLTRLLARSGAAAPAPGRSARLPSTASPAAHLLSCEVRGPSDPRRQVGPTSGAALDLLSKLGSPWHAGVPPNSASPAVISGTPQATI
jgi:hypothetical protein